MQTKFVRAEDLFNGVSKDSNRLSHGLRALIEKTARSGSGQANVYKFLFEMMESLADRMGLRVIGISDLVNATYKDLLSCKYRSAWNSCIMLDTVIREHGLDILDDITEYGWYYYDVTSKWRSYRESYLAFKRRSRITSATAKRPAVDKALVNKFMRMERSMGYQRVKVG